MKVRRKKPVRDTGCGPHLTVGEIARAIEGGVGGADERLVAHLRSCSECFDIYQDSAMSLGLWMEEAPAYQLQRLAEEMKRYFPASAETRPGRIRGSAEAPGARRRYLWRTGLATAAAAVVVVAVLWLGITQLGNTVITRSTILPIRTAVETVSMWGPMILPGGESAIGNPTGVFRSGYVETNAEIEASLSTLFEAYGGKSASAGIAYWLAAGYVSTGQVNLAREVVNDAQKRFPGDPRVQSAAGVIADIDGDLERAEGIFRRLLERNPEDAVTRINLAVVLTEQNKLEDAESVLSEVLARHAGTPLAQRAKSIIDRSTRR
jgi:tetratricopeptide (TPR) repeat protein